MVKYTPNPITSGYSLEKINTNFTNIAAELNDKVLYRDNPVGEPNQMENDFDMNSNDILNAKNIDAQSFSIGGDTDPFSSAAQDATDAAVSAAAALSSENNSAVSETNAATSEANAAATLANALVKSNNLTDVDDLVAARRNIGLGLTINPKDFGAVPGGAIDATAAINSALAFLKTFIETGKDVLGVYLDGGGEKYLCNGSLNATEFRGGHNWGIQNISFIAAANGKTFLDLTGSQFFHLKDLYIWGNGGGSLCYNLIQFARHAAVGVAGDGMCTNVVTEGSASNASLHVNNASRIKFDHCRFTNRHSPDGVSELALNLIVDGSGSAVTGKVPITDFSTVVTTGHATTQIVLSDCFFDKQGTDESSGGAFDNDNIFVAGAEGISFVDCYTGGANGYPFTFHVAESAVTDFPHLINIERLSGEADIGKPFPALIKFTGDAASRTILGFNLSVARMNLALQAFHIDTLTDITIKGFKADIPNIEGAVSATWFDDPTKYFLYDADIKFEQASYLGDRSTFGALEGRVFAYDRTYRETGYVRVSDVKALNVDGGDSVAAWTTRDLNTIVDEDGVASLVSDQVTLAAGRWRCRISAPAYTVGNHRIRLQNITGGSTIQLGTTTFSNGTNGDMTRSSVETEFSIAAGQALAVQHRSSLVVATLGWGTAANLGSTVEEYTIAEFWRID